MKYDFAAIEDKWQRYWDRGKTFAAPNPGQAGFDTSKPKYYVLDMFPYPSGVGLHVGHPLGYIATDIVARYQRMKGFNVLHPMGYDAFGLPAEQFAVEHGVHPRITTEQNIANMTRQLRRLGLSYDWDRVLATTDPGYYRWTQWIFLQLYQSWFNPVLGRARPIAELERALASGELDVGPDGELIPVAAGGAMDTFGGPPIGARRWHELTPPERAEVLDDQRLAYLDEVPVNWCPALGTVLAHEEVTAEGRSERGNHPVFKRPLRQWMLRITAYAQRLASDFDQVDWPESIKALQRNWIGRSVGARVDFAICTPGSATPGGEPASPGVSDEIESEAVTVFTTRPDTLFGATYLVLAPEHPLLEAVATADRSAAVGEYRTRAAAKTDVDRQVEAVAGQKTGVFTGGYAVNPVNGQKIPIWTADYVMMGYGTGAIMAVPAHDQRDFDFARQFGLPIVPVVAPQALPQGRGPSENAGAGPEPITEAFTGEGYNVHSANAEVSLDGLPTAEAKHRITRWLEAKGLGKGAVQYKLRDWLFSRQRYWGEPFPILHGPDQEVLGLDESELPVLLPEMDQFQPAVSDDPDAPPLPPLARAPESWKYVERGGVRYTREFNTMPQWAGSCWYYLRFLDVGNQRRFVGQQAEKYWMAAGKHGGSGPHLSPLPRGEGTKPLAPANGGVDLYVGGVEHAVLHLLYARFWHKVLFDLGQVSTPEPFGRLFNQGYIQAFAYTDARGSYVEAAEVEEKGGKFYHRGQEVKQTFGKMGKSLKNAIAPDDICRDFGCDTLRLYEMYLGPLDQSKTWRTRDISGVHRFLQRLWRVFIDESTGALKVDDGPAPLDLRRLLHKTIKRGTDAMESLSFNVAIAALIELNNELVKRYSSDESKTPGRATAKVPREVAEAMVLCLAPLAPHVAEELWSRLGHPQTLAYEKFPAYDPALLVEDQVEYPVQIGGKLKGHLVLAAHLDPHAVEAAALADPAVRKLIAGRTVRKVIVVPGRLVNLVVE